MTNLQDLKDRLETALNSKPETGEQWAEICLLEQLLIEAKEEEARDNGQFGVAA